MSVLCVCDRETALPSEVRCGSGEGTEMLGSHLLIQQLCARTWTELTRLSKLEIFPSPCLEILNRWGPATDGRMLPAAGFGSTCTGDRSFLIISTYPGRLSGGGACSDHCQTPRKRGKFYIWCDSKPGDLRAPAPLLFETPHRSPNTRGALGGNRACLCSQRNFAFSLALLDRR